MALRGMTLLNPPRLLRCMSVVVPVILVHGASPPPPPATSRLSCTLVGRLVPARIPRPAFAGLAMTAMPMAAVPVVHEQVHKGTG